MKSKAFKFPPLATLIGPLLSGAEATLLGDQWGLFFGILNQGRERSAFLYELAERISGRYECGEPWIGLTEDQKSRLEQRWPDEQEHLILEEGDEDKLPRPGWTRE